MDATAGFSTPVHPTRQYNDLCRDRVMPSETVETTPTGRPGIGKARRKRRKRRYKPARITGDRTVENVYRRSERLQNQEFMTHQKTSRRERPYSRSRRIEASDQQILTENEAYIGSDFDPKEDSLAYCFMTKFDNELRRTDQARLVESFCPRNTLAELQSNNPSVSKKYTCLIDDRENTGTQSVSLGDYGPLDARRLHLKLKEKRFHENSSIETSTMLNADRRLIYITDLDRYGAAALMATVPQSHVIELGDTLHNYIDFKSRIGTYTKPHGFPIFSLYFDLAFYSWVSTRSPTKPCDARFQSHHNPLRKVIDVGFLGGTTLSATHHDYLCEAQVSVLITGMDGRRWTGYCLVDTYYQDADKRERVDRDLDLVEDSDYVMMDPFTEGTYEADQPLLDPREYFLAVLDCRAKLFRDEWKRSTDKMQGEIDGYLVRFPFMVTISTSQDNPSFAWIRQTRQVLDTLIKSLRAGIRSWDNSGPKKQFKTVACDQYFTSIHKTFSDAKLCLDQLETLRKRCNDHMKDLTLCMTDEGTRGTKLQAQIAEYTQTLTFVMLYIISPTNLAAAMLSMQEKAIPGVLGPNRRSFVVLATVLTVFAFILGRIMHHWKQIQAAALGLTRNNQLQSFVRRWIYRGGKEEDIGFV